MAQTNDTGCIDNQKFYTSIFQELPHVAKKVKERAQDEPTYAEFKMRDGESKRPSDDRRFTVQRFAGSQIVPARQLNLQVDYTDDNCQIATKDATVKTGNSECSALGCNEIEAQVTDLGGTCGTTRHIIDAAQGHFTREGEDVEIKAGTDVKCLDALEGLTQEAQEDILGNHLMTLERTLRRSKDFAKLTYIANHAESNFVCAGRNNLAGQRPRFTGPGGWEKVDVNDIDHVTLFHLIEAHEHIGAQKLSHNKIDSIDDFIMEVLITPHAYDEMMYRYETIKTSTLHRYRNNDAFAQNSLMRYKKDMTMTEEKMMMGKKSMKSIVWNDMIRFVFTKSPLKAYQVPDGQFPDGTPRCRFEVVPRFLDRNVEDEHGNGRGVMQFENPQWRENFIICDGIKHELLEAICIIDDESFGANPLMRGSRPNGHSSTPVDLSIILKHGDSVPPITGCPNEDDTQFYYFAQWWNRFMQYYPEFSGIGWHRPNRLQGWNSGLTPVESNHGQGRPEPATTLAEAESCRESDPCDQSPCAEPVNCTVADNLTKLDPCGDLNAPFFGNNDPEIVTLKVSRDKSCSEVADATIDYAITPVPADADECVLDSVYGVDYVAVDEDGVVLPDSGQIEFLAGESGSKSICIRLLQAAPTLPADAPTGPCCEDEEPKAQFTQFSVKLSNPVGTTLDNCDESIVTIENATGA